MAMLEPQTIGLLPLGRPTFDVPFAEEKLAAMLVALEETGHRLVGPRELLFDADATIAAFEELSQANIDQLLILQVTFTDASMTVEAARNFDVPLSIWAVPEPRLGGRLRLNSFCGLNLASHALGLIHREFSWAFADPQQDNSQMLSDLFAGRRRNTPIEVQPSAEAPNVGQAILDRLVGKNIARIGEHPVGFDTCAYDADRLKSLTGVTVEEMELDRLFDTAKSSADDAVQQVREQAERDVSGLEGVNADELDRSLRLKVALEELRRAGQFDAFAIRCWPETFTEYGGAVCGPVSMMGEGRVPCACEADVYGAVTQLILQEAADAPVFLVDLVDIDVEDGTGVVWHCGQAPISMRKDDGEATATIHTNRKMPLLYEFALKPGGVTLLRLSQAFGEPRLVISYGEMLDRPMAFTGTSGVLSFERSADAVLNDVFASGLEHHMAMTYGDHREVLRSVAAALDLPVVEL